jgi:hypothetical protein
LEVVEKPQQVRELFKNAEHEDLSKVSARQIQDACGAETGSNEMWRCAATLIADYKLYRNISVR